MPCLVSEVDLDVPSYLPFRKRGMQPEVNGKNVITWSENNMSFVLVSAEPVERMLEFFQRR